MSVKNVGLKFLVLALLAALVVSGCSNNTNTTEANENESPNTTSSGNVYQWGDSNFEQMVKEAAEGTTLKIGFSPPAASEYYDIMEHGAYTMMNELSDRFGVNFEFEMAAPGDFQSVESQVSTIENWTAKGFDAILVCSAGDFDSMNQSMRRL